MNNPEKLPFWNKRTQTVAVILGLVAFVANTSHGWGSWAFILLVLVFALLALAPMVNGEE